MNKGYYVKLTIIMQKDETENCWLAKCKELGTSTFGDTFEEAQEAIMEAIHLHIEGLIEVGELERFFKDHKIKTISKPPVKEVTVKAPVTPNTFIQSLITPMPDNIAVGVC